MRRAICVTTLLGVLSSFVLSSESQAGCRCRGSVGITMFLSNAECATHCHGAANVDLWPDPENVVGGAIGAVGTGKVPAPGVATSCPPLRNIRQTFRVGGVPFTVTGREDRVKELKAFLERMQVDCLGGPIFRAMAARFSGMGYDDGMKVFLDDGSAHAGCQTDEYDRHNYSGGAGGVYDGYAKMYDAATGTCEYTANSLWAKVGADTRFDSPDLLDTLAHELTHAAYDNGDPYSGHVEGEYCAHLAGWMIGARLGPFPRPPMKIERYLYSNLVEAGSCGYVGRGWADDLREIPSIEGTGGRLAAYLTRCASYREDDLFPSTYESTTCGAGNSSCCPFEPQAAGCRRSFIERIVSSSSAASPRP